MHRGATYTNFPIFLFGNGKDLAMSKCIGLIGYWVFPLPECGTNNVF
jgi:hypothetical protein